MKTPSSGSKAKKKKNDIPPSSSTPSVQSPLTKKARKSGIHVDRDPEPFGPLTLQQHIRLVNRYPERDEPLFTSVSEEDEFRLYLSFLKGLTISLVSPWTDEELTAEYYRKRLGKLHIIEFLAAKIEGFHQRIRFTPIVMGLKIKMIYLAQLEVHEELDKLIKDYDHQMLLDSNKRIVMFRGDDPRLLNLYLERENEQDSRQYTSTLNPYPWGLSEVKLLMESILLTTEKAREYMDTIDVCRAFQKCNETRRSPEQLSAKIEQHLKLGLTKYASQPSKLKAYLKAIYSLRLQVKRELLEGLEVRKIYQQDVRGRITYVRLLEFKYGEFDPDVDVNMNRTLSLLLSFIQNYSVTSLTQLTEDALLTAYVASGQDTRLKGIDGIREYMKTIPFLVELDCRGCLFNQLHTVFLARTRVNQVFQKRSLPYHKNNTRFDRIMGYEANNVIVRFDARSGSTMEHKDDKINRVPTSQSSTEPNPHPKDLAEVVFNFLISLLKTTIQPMSDEEIWKSYRTMAGPITQAEFIAVLHNLKPTIELCDYLDVFTRLRLLFLTSARISDAFKIRARGYEVGVSSNGVLLSFKAIVHLEMALDNNSLPFGILTDVTLFEPDVNLDDSIIILTPERVESPVSRTDDEGQADAYDWYDSEDSSDSDDSKDADYVPKYGNPFASRASFARALRQTTMNSENRRITRAAAKYEQQVMTTPEAKAAGNNPASTNVQVASNRKRGMPYDYIDEYTPSRIARKITPQKKDADAVDAQDDYSPPPEAKKYNPHKSEDADANARQTSSSRPSEAKKFIPRKSEDDDAEDAQYSYSPPSEAQKSTPRKSEDADAEDAQESYSPPSPAKKSIPQKPKGADPKAAQDCSSKPSPAKPPIPQKSKDTDVKDAQASSSRPSDAKPSIHRKSKEGDPKAAQDSSIKPSPAKTSTPQKSKDTDVVDAQEVQQPMDSTDQDVIILDDVDPSVRTVNPRTKDVQASSSKPSPAKTSMSQKLKDADAKDAQASSSRPSDAKPSTHRKSKDGDVKNVQDSSAKPSPAKTSTPQKSKVTDVVDAQEVQQSMDSTDQDVIILGDVDPSVRTVNPVQASSSKPSPAKKTIPQKSKDTDAKAAQDSSSKPSQARTFTPLKLKDADPKAAQASPSRPSQAKTPMSQKSKDADAKDVQACSSTPSQARTSMPQKSREANAKAAQDSSSKPSPAKTSIPQKSRDANAEDVQEVQQPMDFTDEDVMLLDVVDPSVRTVNPPTRKTLKVVKQKSLDPDVSNRILSKSIRFALDIAYNQSEFLDLENVLEMLVEQEPHFNASHMANEIRKLVTNYSENSGFFTTTQRVTMLYMYRIPLLDKHQHHVLQLNGAEVMCNESDQLVHFYSKKKEMQCYGAKKDNKILRFLVYLAKCCFSPLDLDGIVKHFMKWRMKKADEKKLKRKKLKKGKVHNEIKPLDMEYMKKRFMEVFQTMDSINRYDFQTRIKMLWITDTRISEGFSEKLDEEGTLVLEDGKVQTYKDENVDLDYQVWLIPIDGEWISPNSTTSSSSENSGQSESSSEQRTPEEPCLETAGGLQRENETKAPEIGVVKRMVYRMSSSPEGSLFVSQSVPQVEKPFEASSKRILEVINDHLPISILGKLAELENEIKSANVYNDKMPINDVMSALDYSFDCFIRSASITNDRTDTAFMREVLTIFARIARSFEKDFDVVPEMREMFNKMSGTMFFYTDSERVPINDVKLILDCWLVMCVENGHENFATRMLKEIDANEPPTTNKVSKRACILEWLEQFVNAMAPNASEGIKAGIEAVQDMENRNPTLIDTTDIVRTFRLVFRLAFSVLSTEGTPENSKSLFIMVNFFNYVFGVLKLPELHPFKQIVERFLNEHEGSNFRISNKKATIIAKLILMGCILRDSEASSPEIDYLVQSNSEDLAII